MELDLSPLLSDLTAVAAVVVVLYLAFRAVKPFIDKAAESLDRMSKGYIGYHQAQVDITNAVRELCQEVRDGRDEDRERDEVQDKLLQVLAERVQEMGGMFSGMQQQLQAHEGRAQKRHEQQLAQGQQQMEQNAEILKALQKLNGGE